MSGADETGNEKFLSRWSRLKTEPEAPAAPGPAPVDAPEGGSVQTADDEGDPDVIAGLPDIDTLDKDSDFTVFMQDGVPEALRNLALRKLWQSDPVLANLDGLNDYDEDFGAILREGAAYMKKLADAGERMTRPGADDDEAAVLADEADEAGDDEAETLADADDDGAASDDEHGADSVKST